MAELSTSSIPNDDRERVIESKILDLVRLCARQAAREWLADACPPDPPQEAADEK